MSAQVEIYDLSLAPIDSEVLWGRNIDHPKVGALLEGTTITIESGRPAQERRAPRRPPLIIGA